MAFCAAKSILTTVFFTSLLCLGRCGVFESAQLSLSATSNDNFGFSVAFSSDGTRALVGAPSDDTKGLDSGAVHMFHLAYGVNSSEPSNWTKLYTLYTTEAGFDDQGQFGYSVALADDGKRAVVGEPFNDASGNNKGRALVFDEDPSAQIMTPIGQLLPAPSLYSCNFGYSVAISAAGNRVLVGAPNQGKAGAVYGFYQVSTSWVRPEYVQRTIKPEILIRNQQQFGYSVALSSDGHIGLAGAPGVKGYWVSGDEPAGAGVATVIRWTDSNSLSASEELTPSNAYEQARFGESVAISSDGMRALIGAPGDDTMGNNAGASYVFDKDDDTLYTWSEQSILFPSNADGEPGFGKSVAISSDGARALVGANNDDVLGNDVGATYVFDANPFDPNHWREQTTVYPSNGTEGLPTKFGRSMACSSDGTRMAVSTGAGRTFLFSLTCPSGLVPNEDETECVEGDWPIPQRDDDGASTLSSMWSLVSHAYFR